MTAPSSKTVRRLPSEVEQVAALNSRECHWKMRRVGEEATPTTSYAGRVAEAKRSLASGAQKTIQRVLAKHPDRKFETQTAACITSKNAIFVGVMIERVDVASPIVKRPPRHLTLR